MKRIEVSAGIIVKDNKIFITQRGYGNYKDYWEFPGGKLEVNETPREALHRELKEELNIKVNIIKELKVIEWDYPEYHVTMHAFICSLISDHIELLEHEDAKFITKDKLKEVNFLESDFLLLDDIINYIDNLN